MKSSKKEASDIPPSRSYPCLLILKNDANKTYQSIWLASHANLGICIHAEINSPIKLGESYAGSFNHEQWVPYKGEVTISS